MRACEPAGGKCRYIPCGAKKGKARQRQTGEHGGREGTAPEFPFAARRDVHERAGVDTAVHVWRVLTPARLRTCRETEREKKRKKYTKKGDLYACSGRQVSPGNSEKESCLRSLLVEKSTGDCSHLTSGGSLSLTDKNRGPKSALDISGYAYTYGTFLHFVPRHTRDLGPF